MQRFSRRDDAIVALGNLQIEAFDVDQLAFYVPKAILALIALAGDVTGVHRFAFESEDGKVTGVSNPIWVRHSPDTRIFWGDSHGHSGVAEGLGSPEGSFEYGRDDARLDFLTLSEHDIWLDDREWHHLQEIAADFTEEDRFIGILGYEWTMPTNRGGHHNVYFRTPGGRVRQGLHTATSLAALYQDLRAANQLDDVLIIPHCHEAGEWRMNDPELERLVEIMSMHGTFEWFGRAYLAQGSTVGFVASSDDHIGMPGYSGPRRASQQRNGLAAVLAHAKTPDAILDALRDRATYATTGARIILDATLDRARMGTRIEFPESVAIVGRVIGTAPIDTVTVVKNGEDVWRRDYLTATSGDAERGPGRRRDLGHRPPRRLRPGPPSRLRAPHRGGHRPRGATGSSPARHDRRERRPGS